jgi:ubiquinone/menaquinone biosynthesis C-methylase UbiE
MEAYPSPKGGWDSALALADSEWLGLTGETVPAPGGTAVTGPHNPQDFARRLFAREALNPASRQPRANDLAEPYSLEWFVTIEAHRHSKHGRWIPKLLEFTKHAGETLLGIGDGLGTDWLQYARHGARVIVCSPSTSQLGLIRRNFELRGLEGRFLHARLTSLPLASASVDVACITSLMQGVQDAHTLIDEVYRVLKPGGKVLAVTPSKYDVDFWYRTAFLWLRWFSRRRRDSNAAHRFSGRGLKRLFGQFIEHRIHKRQLRRSEVPHVWRWVPLSLLARLMGRALVVKAFKPLSAALPALRAAA